MSEIKFYYKTINNIQSLWVNDQCIWNLKKSEFTDDVVSAIINSFFIGSNFIKSKIYEIETDYQLLLEFKELK